MATLTQLSMFDAQARGNWVRLRTLLTLRWMAIAGQLGAVLVASQVLGFQLPLALCMLAISASVSFNVIAHIIQPAEKRLSEEVTEHLHERVRRKIWGYASGERLDKQAHIGEQYLGIRPAPGYPACPDHSEKRKLFDLLDAETNARMELTSGYAMLPAASVSGYYFAHPQAQYFVLGNILEDQLEDYAGRKGVSVEQARQLLVSNLA